MERVRPGTAGGVKTKPAEKFSESSESRLGFPPERICSDWLSSSGAPVTAKRVVSRSSWEKVREPVDDWTSDGARKPVLHDARTSSQSATGCQASPIFGFTVEPKSL